jgi:hypothetical protein
MQPRHIQNFLMVSAAFFAMSGPARSEGANALAVAATPLLQIAAGASDIIVPGWAASVAVRHAGVTTA